MLPIHRRLALDAVLWLHEGGMGNGDGNGNYLHGLQVLVSGIRVALDDLVTAGHEAELVREEVRDRIDLVIELLRALQALEAGSDGRVQVVDGRSLLWLVRCTHPEVFMGKMPMAVWVRTNVQAALELLDVVVSWVRAEGTRVRLVLVAHPPSLFVVGSPSDGYSPASPLDREMEQTIMSLAGAARVEASLRDYPRTAKLDFLLAEEDFVE
ncbi:MAG TPA: hypothetical protein PLJ27_21855 [Polyangiaceae bacterium]|nr:hypothetical protein [Polyangiaceae bacterium]